MEIEKRIEEMGLALPELPVRADTRRVRAVRTGNLVFLSGHGPYKDGEYPFKGPLPSAISVEDARDATRYNALALLATLRQEIGDLDRVRRIVMVHAFVYGEAGFNQAPAVANGASDLLMDIYGDRGPHARSAVTVNGLALDICCEVEMVVEVEPD